MTTAYIAAFVPPPYIIPLDAVEVTDRMRLAYSPNLAARCATTQWMLMELVGPRKPTRQLAAMNPALPHDTLTALAYDFDNKVRRGAAWNPMLDSRHLEQFAIDTDDSLRIGAAGNPSTPQHTLRRLAEDIDSDVVVNVAYNPSTPPDVLEGLYTLGPSVHDSALAANPSTPPDVLAKMLTRASITVRRIIASNPATALETRALLATDEDAGVRQLANIPALVYPKPFDAALHIHDVLKHPHACAHVAAYLASHSEFDASCASFAEAMVQSWPATIDELLDAAIAACR